MTEGRAFAGRSPLWCTHPHRHLQHQQRRYPPLFFVSHLRFVTDTRNIVRSFGASRDTYANRGFHASGFRHSCTQSLGGLLSVPLTRGLVHPTQHRQSIAHARRRTPKQQPQGVRGLHATVSIGFPFSPARELLATVSVIGASPICHRGDDDHLLGPPEADPDPRGAALS